MQNKYIVPVVVVFVIVVVIGVFKLGGFGSKSMAPAEPVMEATNTPTVAVTEAMMQKDEMTEPSTSEAMMDSEVITVEAANYSYNPKTITVKKGEKVKILFKNLEGFHDFIIDEFNVKTAQIKAGEEETVEFTPMEAGEYEYYCSVGKHREMGMVGTLTVE